MNKPISRRANTMRVITGVELCDGQIYNVELGAKITHSYSLDKWRDPKVSIFLNGGRVIRDKPHKCSKLKLAYMVGINPRTTGTGRYVGRMFQQLPVALQRVAISIAKKG